MCVVKIYQPYNILAKRPPSFWFDFRHQLKSHMKIQIYKISSLNKQMNKLTWLSTIVIYSLLDVLAICLEHSGTLLTENHLQVQHLWMCLNCCKNLKDCWHPLVSSKPSKWYRNVFTMTSQNWKFSNSLIIVAWQLVHAALIIHWVFKILVSVMFKPF